MISITSEATKLPAKKVEHIVVYSFTANITHRRDALLPTLIRTKLGCSRKINLDVDILLLVLDLIQALF